jgi:predicted nucleic acid-binding protein
MKALDTPVLLSLLEGDAAARDAVRRLRGHELATTEVNLLELTVLAATGGARSGVARRAAIARLRRKMTVLPIDGRAIEEAGRRVSPKDAARIPPHLLAMAGTLEANGCDELLTSGLALPGRWRFRVTQLGPSKRK